MEQEIQTEEEIDKIYLTKSKNTYCYTCGACDPLNSYGVCFLCGKIPHIKTFLGLKKVIQGWFVWHLRKIKKFIAPFTH